VPVDFEVIESKVLSLTVPLKIKEHAPATVKSGETADGDAHIVATFKFYGPMGWSFGEEFQIKIKVEKQLDEVEFYNLAIKLF